VIEKHETIMVVEDEADDVALLQRAFRKVGILNPVVFLADGEHAVQYLAGEGEYCDRARCPLPSLILLDLKLPRKSGLDVLAWIGEQLLLRRIPVVVLTGSRQSSDLESAYELGANSYLVKPVAFDDLMKMIDALKLYWIVFNETPKAAG
jgi:CheY-like chemotaxis protein